MKELFSSHTLRRIGLLPAIILLLKTTSSAAQLSLFSTTADPCYGCTACEPASTGSFGLPFHEFPFVLLAVLLGIGLIAQKNKLRKMLWTLGVGLFLGLSLSVANQQGSNIAIAESAADSSKLSLQSSNLQQADHSTVTDSSAVTADDEFQTVEGSDEFVTVGDSSEFTEFEQTAPAENSSLDENDYRSLVRVGLALFACLLAGLIYRYPVARKFRFGFLLAALVYLGFYSSGCPCMISSFQNVVLLFLGEPTRWITLIWFLGLLPLTYFFGKVWCGWVCHLGAFQEFIYRPGKMKLLQSAPAQKALKITQYVALAALLIQLVLTRTNLFIKIDPFKVAFNLFSANLTGYILLALMLLSSLLIYRPFCRGFCPVGLILGWVERIPGASKLQIDSSCKSCMKCEKECDSRAILKDTDSLRIDQESCIRCGDCLDNCRFGSIRSHSFLIKK